MSQEELRRLDVIRRLEARRLTTKEAGEVLGITERQVRRLRRRVEKEGAQGLAHRSRGRASARKTKASVTKRVVGLMRKLYAGFNDQHFTEKLAAVEGIALSRSTVRRLLRQAGIGAARKRRPPRHRSRRDRRPRAGLMILWDGSRHEWLERRGPMLCLMGAVDDATSEFLPGAHFLEQECAAGYLRVLLAIAEEKGLPLSAYGDQHGSLKRNDDSWTLEEELRGEQDPTQVGRALRALGIERIDALSPQAKGRVERLWGTLQDRLVSELRLAKARTADQANAVLERFRPEHNRRFAVAPAEQEPAWRPVRQGLDLRRTCAFQYMPTVLNDNTIRISGEVIDIPAGPGHRGYARARVQAVQMLDGAWRVYKGDTLIARKAATSMKEPRALKQRKRSAASMAFRQAVLAL
jgi:transposase